MTQTPSYEQLQQRVTELEARLANVKQHHGASLQTEKFYSQLFEHMLHEIHVWELVRDDKGEIQTWRLLDANPAALKVWHKELSQVVGKTAEEIFPESDPVTLFISMIREIFATGKPYAWESTFPSTGQTLYMISIPVDEMFISVGMDISRMKAAEAKLRDTYLQLTEAISSGNVGLWDWNLLTDEVYFSGEWKAQLGCAEHEISNRYEEWESRLHPDDKERAVAKIAEVLQSPSRYYENEFRLRHKDGAYRWIFAHASLLSDEQGAPVRMVGSHIDVTERKQMESTLLQIQKMDALGTLAGGIAHDFNNLLAPILGYTELAKLRLDQDSEERRYLTNVEESANRAKDLVRKILLISKSSLTQPESVNLKGLVEEVITVLKASAPKFVVIDDDLTIDLPDIMADPSQIYQLVLNLCTNAIQAIDGPGRVSISLQRARPKRSKSIADTDYLCLSVCDDGSGLDSASLDKIFDPFYTTKQKGEQRGTGLGLSIVDSVVKHHDGLLEVDSELGQGTEFRIYFPIKGIAVSEQSQASSAESALGHARVLFVDDERMIGDLAGSMFKQLGLDATILNDSEKALAVFSQQAQAFDIVITDHSMPGLSGPQLIAEMKTIRPDIPALLLTGFSNLATEENMLEWQCAGTITKPFKLNELRQAISEVLTSCVD